MPNQTTREILQDSHSRYTATEDDQYRYEYIGQCEKQLYEAILTEVIGEDETYTDKPNVWSEMSEEKRSKWTGQQTRNILRRNIRNKLKVLFGEDEK